MMQILLLIVFSVVLALTSVGGGFSNVATLERLLALLLLALIPFIYLIWRKRGDVNWTHYPLALLFVAFFYLSGVWAPGDPTLGMPVTVAIHVLVWGAYLFFLVRGLGRSARGQESDRENRVVALDIWLANLGVIVLVLFLCDEFARRGFSWSMIAAGLGRGVSHLTLAVAFLLLARTTNRFATQRLASLMLIAGLLIGCGLGGFRLLQAQQAVRDAKLALTDEEADISEALKRLDAVQDANEGLESERLRLSSLELRREAYVRQERYGPALEALADYLLEPRRRQAYLYEEFEYLDFMARYLENELLEPLIARHASRKQVHHFFQLHEDLRTQRDACEDMHLLFLENGYIDRLEETYASAGFPVIRDTPRMISALERIARNQPEHAISANFFLGILHYQGGNYMEAESAFQRVMQEFPNHPNAISYMERMAELRGQSEQLGKWRDLPRHLHHRDMIGNQQMGLMVAQTLWSAFEANPGAYELALEVRGRKAAGEWPRISVYLGDSDEPIHTSVVNTADWKTISIRKTFEEEGRSRLLIVFENDYYAKLPGGEVEDRNLYFREAAIQYHPTEQ